jgi:hypothetical protein
MLMPRSEFWRRLKWPLGILGIASFGLISFFAGKEVGEENHSKTAYEYGSGFYVFTLSVIDRIRVFVEENDNLIVAVSTVAIAFFTFTLWRATNKLWSAGEKQIGVAQAGVDAAKAANQVSQDNMNASLSS